MPQLDRDAVTGWITAYEPSAEGGLAELIRQIEEGDDARHALADLGRELDEAHRTEALRSALLSDLGREDLHAVLAQLGTARLLRLLRWLGSETGDPGPRVLAAQFDYPPDDPLRAVLADLHRQALLARMFSDERLAELLAAARVAEGEAA